MTNLSIDGADKTVRTLNKREVNWQTYVPNTAPSR